MAKKKEGNSIGYVVLSIIPIIGIIWAVVAGIQHNSYVKDANNAEKQFEVHLKEKMNELHNSSDAAFADFPEITDDLNVTCLLPIAHSSLLLGDDVNTERSYTIEVGANPVLKEENGEKVLDYFDFKLEFFVSLEVYQDICENYMQETLVVEGIKDNTFETYYKHNPRHAPVYKISQYFDTYCTHVSKYEYKTEVIKGTGAIQVIALIDELGEITADSDFDLKRIANIYGNLPDDEKANVTNYNAFLDARAKCNAKILDKKISDKLTEIGTEYKFSQYSVLEGFVTDYGKIEEAHKADVTKYSDLVVALKNVYGKCVDNYVNKFKDTAFDAMDNSAYKQVENAVKYFNSLAGYCATLDEVKSFITEGFYDTLADYVSDYNAKNTKKDPLALASFE